MLTVKTFSCGPDEIRLFVVGRIFTNCYAYISRGECLVIDVGATGAEVRDQLRDVSIKAVVATHGHGDHVSGLVDFLGDDQLAPVDDATAVPAFAEKLAPADGATAAGKTARAGKIPFLMHKNDIHLAQKPTAPGYFPEDTLAPLPSATIADGDVLSVGTAQFRVIETPGHSSGAVCFAGQRTAGGIVFTGDTLFAGSAGRTDFEDGNFDVLMSSLNRLKQELPPVTIVCPGHDDITTMERELASNPFYRNF